MNTSSKTGVPQNGSHFPATGVESFRYPEAIATDFLGNAAPDGALCAPAEDDVTRLVVAAHAKGLREGEDNERTRAVQQLEQERERVGKVIASFQSDVADYYSRMEVEVVKLALAIASKILHREAQADPTLVAQLAKAALKKLHQNTRVRVRVRAAEAQHWQQFLAHQDDGQTLAAEVIADDSVDAQSCILETQLGSADVSIGAQLKELESGLFDLLAETPVAK